eukprot:7384065-Prymnesium_polylepis.1
MDYLHMSTRNRIVRGEEVPFAAAGIANAHFRRLAVKVTANTSNGSIANISNKSVGSPPSSSAAVGGCSDVPGTFGSIVVCTGGAECAQGMVAAAGLFGGWEMACRISVAYVRERAIAIGCPLAFTPPADDDAAMSQLCPVTCIAAGIEVQGCAVSPAAPPAPPTPPMSPPMPPLIPGPSGFTTVGTVAQLRAAIEAAPSGSALALFVPPGHVFYLEGSAIV